MLGSEELANDVVHDAFVAVYQRWDSLDEPGPYLNVTVLNGCRGVHRRRSRYERLVPRLLDRGAASSVGECLDDVLAQLPFNHRAAVELRFYGGLATGEIARALGCAPGGPALRVRRRGHRVRRPSVGSVVRHVA